MQRVKRAAVCILCMLCMLLPVLAATGCGTGNGREAAEYIRDIGDMKDRALTVGYPDDLVLDDLIAEICPGATLSPQNDILAVKSVSSGKLDCYICGRSYLENYLAEHPDEGLRILDEPLVEFQAALGLYNHTPVEDYVYRVNEAIAELKRDGTLADMERRWMKDGNESMPDIPLPEHPAYTIRAVTFGQEKPFTYMKDGKPAGFDVELATRVAAYLGCGIRFDTASFPAMLMGVTQGKYDMIASNLYVTEDRSDNMTFSDPYYSNPISIIVREDPSANKSFHTLLDLKQAERFGNVTGLIFDRVTAKYYPDAEILQYNSLMDEIVALADGKIDAVLFDYPTLRYVCNEHTEVKLLPGYLEVDDYHYLTQKNERGRELAGEFNRWLAERREDGTLEEMETFWIGTESPEGRLDIGEGDGSRGTLLIGHDVTSRPDIFYYNNKPTGYSIELILRFCRDCGYRAELVPTRNDSFINSLQSGRIDLFLGFMSYTQERAENVTFTDAVFEGGIVAAVRNEAEPETGFFQDVAKSFRKTLIDENRWRLILNGLLITLLITFGGFLLANLLGAAFCALAMSKRRSLRTLEDIYSRIMQGTPIVVVLMILYYVIFAKSQISGIWVAMIGFGLSSGAGLAQLFYGGIRGVEKGQKEAALALGFTRSRAFFGIILPQAIRTMLPGYFSSLIALMKGTAVVGYVAVLDLTKMSDIIRSSTYEAFFPLILVAVLYFAIACILLSVMKAIQRKLAPRRGSGKEAGTK